MKNDRFFLIFLPRMAWVIRAETLRFLKIKNDSGQRETVCLTNDLPERNAKLYIERQFTETDGVGRGRGGTHIKREKLLRRRNGRHTKQKKSRLAGLTA